MAAGYRTPTPRDLAQDELLIDRAGGRRYCPVHRDQEMIALVPGVDRCPLPHGEGAASDQ